MADKQAETRNDIVDVLGTGRHTAVLRRWRWPGAVLAVLLLAGGGYWLLAPGKSATVRYDTAEVRRGDLTVTVSATGTVQPVNQVDVGSELSGTIEAVFVDFNDHVKQGQVLARLDTDRLQAKVIEARSSLESAKARHQEAEATVVETRLRHERCKKLTARQLCSREDLDTLRAAYARARAVEASTRAQVAMAQATLEANETDLGKAEIRSPIDGLVLRRQIEPGQTVAASLQAPVLFTLAEDLAHMELLVAVDEADVGKIAEGQSAEFTVDAYPDRRFPAHITQVRFAPQTIEGVVTYETVLSVENADLSLRPGMTATAVVTVAQLTDVVLVPNAALRFTPPVTRVRSNASIFSRMFRRPRAPKRRTDTNAKSGQKLWVLRDDQPATVMVKTGASDGRFTVLREGDLKPGDAVIVDAVTSKK